MKALLISFFIFLVTQSAYADTQGFFNENTATVILQGQPGDMDAVGLYNTLNVTPTEDSNFLKKSVTYTTISKIKVLDVVCKISKSISNFGSCTLALYKSQWTSIGSSSVLFAFGLDEDSELAGQLFLSPNSNGLIYESHDGKLSVRLDAIAANKLFSIAYR